jgi:GAF domain-containing protein
MNNSSTPPVHSDLLLELGQAYYSMHELDPTLASMLKQMQSAVNSEGGSIWLLNDAETEIECAHAIGTQTAKLKGHVIRAKKFFGAYRSVSGRLIQDRDPYSSKWMDAKAYRNNFNIEARNQIGIPLVARGKLIGEINIINKIGKENFTSADLNFISTLAARIAIAIQNTQLYQQRNRTGERQKLLNQISRHLHQTLDIDELIPRIFMDVNKAINAEAQSIWLVNEKEGIINCRFATGPGAVRLKGFSVRLNAPSIVGKSVSKQESIIIRDAQNDPRHARAADEITGYITRSLMTVPLVLEDRSIGAIQAEINEMVNSSVRMTSTCFDPSQIALCSR